MVKTAVKEIDSRAFIVVHPLSDAEGYLIKKSALHYSRKSNVKIFE